MLTSDVDYAISIWKSYNEQISQTTLQISNAKILELGPGKNLGTALLFSCQNAHVTTADPYHHNWDAAYHPEFYKLLLEKAHELNLDTLAPLEQLIVANSYSNSPVRIITETAENLKSLKDDEFEFVVSNAVFEHIPNPLQALEELNRITKINGRGVHQIDLRDHRDFSRPLEYLSMDDYSFGEMFRDRHGECGNRFRSSDFRNFFIHSGFRLNSEYPNVFANPDYIMDIFPRRQKWAVRYSLQDLYVLSAKFCIEKIYDLETAKKLFKFSPANFHHWSEAKRPLRNAIKESLKSIIPAQIRALLRRLITQ